MAKDDRPRYFVSDQYRHLLMSVDYFHENTQQIEMLLETHGFNPDHTVTRIDDLESDMVEFVQFLDTEEHARGHHPYTERVRKTPYN